MQCTGPPRHVAVATRDTEPSGLNKVWSVEATLNHGHWQSSRCQSKAPLVVHTNAICYVHTGV